MGQYKVTVTPVNVLGKLYMKTGTLVNDIFEGVIFVEHLLDDGLVKWTTLKRILVSYR